VTDGRTDGQTDRIAIANTRYSYCCTAVARNEWEKATLNCVLPALEHVDVVAALSSFVSEIHYKFICRRLPVSALNQYSVSFPVLIAIVEFSFRAVIRDVSFSGALDSCSGPHINCLAIQSHFYGLFCGLQCNSVWMYRASDNRKPWQQKIGDNIDYGSQLLFVLK